MIILEKIITTNKFLETVMWGPPSPVMATKSGGWNVSDMQDVWGKNAWKIWDENFKKSYLVDHCTYYSHLIKDNLQKYVDVTI